MKNLTKFAVIGAILVSTAGAAFAQQNGTTRDNTGNQTTGGSGNQMPDKAHKNNGGN